MLVYESIGKISRVDNLELSSSYEYLPEHLSFQRR